MRKESTPLETARTALRLIAAEASATVLFLADTPAEGDDAQVTLRLTPEQLTAIRDAVRDLLIAAQCCECGKHRADGGEWDDLRRCDHEDGCALLSAHEELWGQAP